MMSNKMSGVQPRPADNSQRQSMAAQHQPAFPLRPLSPRHGRLLRLSGRAVRSRPSRAKQWWSAASGTARRVSAASYEARKFGVHSAMPLRTAGHLPPRHLRRRPPRPLPRLLARVRDVLDRFSPLVEMASIDEAPRYDRLGRLLGPPSPPRNSPCSGEGRRHRLNCSSVSPPPPCSQDHLRPGQPKRRAVGRSRGEVTISGPSRRARDSRRRQGHRAAPACARHQEGRRPRRARTGIPRKIASANGGSPSQVSPRGKMPEVGSIAKWVPTLTQSRSATNTPTTRTRPTSLNLSQR